MEAIPFMLGQVAMLIGNNAAVVQNYQIP